MGELVDGVWRTGWLEPDPKGAFQRAPTTLRDRITQAGELRPEPGRYHLYVSYACPWAHRTLITRALRGLEDAISLTVVDPKMDRDGWVFPKDEPDPILGATKLRDVYLRADKKFSGRVTVPILWDKRTSRIVNNESREIMRMLDTEFDGCAQNHTSLAPPELREQVDQVLDALYMPVNNGVYRAGFATTQEAHEEACREVFVALDHWDELLGKQRYLCGAILTEADIALFTTLLRFDLVYYGHFKCNLRRVQDYANLSGYLREIYQLPDVKKTCRLDQIKLHYYWSHGTLNPHRIVPLGPTIDLEGKHDRARFA